MLENAREDVEELPDRSVDDYAMGLPFFFLDPIMTDNTPVLAAANRTKTTVAYTRESDGDVITGLPSPFPHLILLGLMLTLSITVLLAGAGGNGTAVSLAGFVVLLMTPIAVRALRGLFFDDRNRNQLIANKTEDVHREEEGRTLLITGGKHGPEVKKRLPDHLVEDYIEPNYRMASWQGLRDILPGLAVAFYLLAAVWFTMAVVSGAVLLPALARFL